MDSSFKSTKNAIKKLPILPILSYGFLSLFIGYIIDLISGIGGNAYLISEVGLPVFVGIIDRFSEDEILKCITEDWKKLPTEAHYLFIFNVFIYHFLFNNYLEEIKNIWNQMTNFKNLSK